jgi:CheY-like chemotaxis protein
MHCSKILIVEDDECILYALVELLAEEGYEVIPAHHGKEALKILQDRKEDPCLIITDLMMPEMDGFELMKILQELDIVISIPIVVMTASNSNASNGKQLIRKPFNLEVVVQTVKKHCGDPKTGKSLSSQTVL